MDDKKLNSVIRNDPSFYNDDSFDIDLFRGFLSRLGMTPDSFKEYVKSKYLAVDLQTILSKDINFSNKFIRQFIEANNQTVSTYTSPSILDIRDRFYMGKAVSYTHLTLPTKRIV